jgi:phosphatidylserine synthase 2
MINGKAELAISSPMEWTHFEWKSTKRLRNYISVVTLVSVFLLSELNVFYLK